MTSIFKKTALATALAATALVSATPAMADGYRGHRGNDVAGPAIAAGIFGLAIGAIIASSSNHHNDRYEDGYYNNGYYNNGYTYRDGYYYDRNGRRYDRQGHRYDNDGRAYGYDRDHGEYRGEYRGSRGW